MSLKYRSNLCPYGLPAAGSNGVSRVRVIDKIPWVVDRKHSRNQRETERRAEGVSSGIPLEPLIILLVDMTV